MATLEAVVRSMATTAQQAGIAIVTGDTKVVPRGAADKLFINTAGIGAIPGDIHWGAQQISAGDVLLVSGTLGDHGATILNLREQLGLDGALSSDCAVLTPLIQTCARFRASKRYATPPAAASTRWRTSSRRQRLRYRTA